MKLNPIRLKESTIQIQNNFQESSNNFNCNCNYILFTKLPWPGDSERTFRSSSQAATCPRVYHTREGFTLSL